MWSVTLEVHWGRGQQVDRRSALGGTRFTSPRLPGPEDRANRTTAGLSVTVEHLRRADVLHVSAGSSSAQVNNAGCLRALVAARTL